MAKGAVTLTMGKEITPWLKGRINKEKNFGRFLRDMPKMKTEEVMPWFWEHVDEQAEKAIWYMVFNSVISHNGVGADGVHKKVMTASVQDENGGWMRVGVKADDETKKSRSGKDQKAGKGDFEREQVFGSVLRNMPPIPHNVKGLWSENIFESDATRYVMTQMRMPQNVAGFDSWVMNNIIKAKSCKDENSKATSMVKFNSDGTAQGVPAN